MDMWDSYIASTKSHVKDAESKIVFDRFYIMKHMNVAVDDVRRSESRTVEAKELLIRSRHIWICSQENLPERYSERFELLKKYDLKTARDYAIKENLRNFWQSATEEEVRSFWNDWYRWAVHSMLVQVKKVSEF